MLPLLSTAYLPPISYFSLIVQNGGAVIDVEEFFHKQSYRNRCVIYGPNGAQNLIIPVEHHSIAEGIGSLRISYSEKWQKNHWKSLVSAYKNSPFFDILEAELRPFYETQFEFLFDYNLALIRLICRWLQINPQIGINSAPVDKTLDFRQSIHPKCESIIPFPTTYYQQFASKHGFIHDLSVVDIIFHEGYLAWDYLEQVSLKNHLLDKPVNEN